MQQLQLIALQCPPPEQPESLQVCLDESGGRIGRSRNCELSLPDPQRHVSREHVEIHWRDGAFMLTVVSQVNGVLVNDCPAEPGDTVRLADGDRILVGEYLLQANVVQPKASSAAAPWAPVPTGGMPGFGADGVFHGFDALSQNRDAAALAGTASDACPWDVLFPMPAGSPVPGSPPSPPLPATVSASSFPCSIDDILDEGTVVPQPPHGREPGLKGTNPGSASLYHTHEFEKAFEPAPAPAPSGIREAAEPRLAPAPAASRASAPGPAATPEPQLPIDDIFSVLAADLALSPHAPVPTQPSGGQGAGPDVTPVPAVTAPVRDAAAPAAVPDDDIFSVLAADFASDTPEPASAPAQPSVGHSAGLLQSCMPCVPVPATAEAAPVPGDGAALVHVLAQALGLEPNELDDTRPQQTIALVGELLRATLEGLFKLLQMRSQLKAELHIADRTMIASRENNPLKHAGSLHDAMAYLVDARQHGNRLFMAPQKAVQDAVWDVCAHEMAVMAGTRAALLASLRLFEPAAIEDRIEKSGALDAVLPALHKSKLWEQFLQTYSALEREAEDHFDQLLNQEFAKAYAEQSRLLRKQSATGSA